VREVPQRVGGGGLTNIGTATKNAAEGLRDGLKGDENVTAHVAAANITIFEQDDPRNQPDVYPRIIISDDDDISPVDLENSPSGYFIVEHKMQVTALDRGPEFADRLDSVRNIADDVWEWMEQHTGNTDNWSALVPTYYKPDYVWEDKSRVNVISAFIIWCVARIAVK